MTDKQPDPLVLADALTCEASFDIHHLAVKAMKESAALLRTQHSAIERKDALLKQALEAFGADDWKRLLVVMSSITKEIGQ